MWLQSYKSYVSKNLGTNLREVKLASGTYGARNHENWFNDHDSNKINILKYIYK
jgi:hypothetical protein